MTGDHAGAPFQRGRFDALPERPTRAHGDALAEARDLWIDSKHFGRIRIHLREYGQGPPLLLVHGLMTTGYSYRYLLEPLGARHRLLVPDLPGCGRSEKPEVRYGASALAGFLGELVDALGIRGCAAVGNSLGGYLCMRLALRDPTALSRLVDIHSPAFPELRLRAMGLALRVPGVAAALGAFIGRAPQRWAHANVHYFDESLKSLEEAEAYGGPLASPEGRRAFIAYLRDAVSAGELAGFARELARRRAAGQGFPIPLCLVYARQDPMVSPKVGERLAKLLPDAPMYWLERSSHFAQVDSPERVAEIVEHFLSA